MMQFLLLDREENLVDYLVVFEAVEESSINSDSTLQFKTNTNINFEKDFRILFQDSLGEWHEYIIQSFKDIHDSNNNILREVYCENSFYETLTDYLDDIRPSNCTATAALEQALIPSRWEVGVVEDLGLNSTNFYRCSVKDAVQNKVVSVWGGEFSTSINVIGNKIVSRKINIYKKLGNDNGKRFEYKKDIQEVQRLIKEDDIVTALYGYGKGEEIEETGGYGRRINFSDINGGKAYVENNDARLVYGRNSKNGKVHKFSKIEFDDITDKYELLELTKSQLDIISKPRITYSAKVIDLSKLGYKFENVRLGDTVTVIDDDLGIKIKARVIKLIKHLGENLLNEITLGNFIETTSDLFLEAYEKLNEFRDKEAIWDKAGKITQNGIDGDYLKNVIDKLNMEINASGGYVYISDDGDGLITYNKPKDKNPDKAIQIVGGSFRIANKKKSNGDWDWRTFGTGDGFVADEIITGILKGGKVKWNLNDGTLLIGESIENYLLYFDGSTLKFGSGSIKKDDLEDDLKEELSGESSFTHIVYADNGNPEGTFFIEPEDHKWIGIAVTDSVIRPILKKDYTWSKYTGEDGKPGPKGDKGDKGDDGDTKDWPQWIKEWDGTATRINGKWMVTPAMYAGTSSRGVFIDENGITGRGYNNSKTFKLNTNGSLVLGSNGRTLEVDTNGRLKVPQIIASDIVTGTITTDILYPGSNNRIVLERGYSPGSNDCKSIDANGDAIRLKVDAGTYIRMNGDGSVGMYSSGRQFFTFNPNYGWSEESTGYSGKGRLNIYTADVYAGWINTYGTSHRSDISLKENIKFLDMNYIYRKNNEHEVDHLNRDEIYDFIKKEKIATYNYKDIKVDSISMIAQSVLQNEKIAKYLIDKSDKKYSIKEYQYVSMIHVALQEEIKRNDLLEKKIESIESVLRKSVFLKIKYSILKVSKYIKKVFT